VSIARPLTQHNFVLLSEGYSLKLFCRRRQQSTLHQAAAVGDRLCSSPALYILHAEGTYTNPEDNYGVPPLRFLRRRRAGGALPCRENGLRRWLTVRRTVVAFCNVFAGRGHGAFGRHDQRSCLRGGGGLVGRASLIGVGGGPL
jgi:hypothetical protein